VGQARGGELLAVAATLDEGFSSAAICWSSRKFAWWIRQMSALARTAGSA